MNYRGPYVIVGDEKCMIGWVQDALEHKREIFPPSL